MLTRSSRPTPGGHRPALYLTATVLLVGLAAPMLIQLSQAGTTVQTNARIDPETHIAPDGLMTTPASPEALALLEQAHVRPTPPEIQAMREQLSTRPAVSTATHIPHQSPSQAFLLQESERIVRALENTNEPLRIGATDGGRLDGGGKTESLLQVTANDRDGRYVASMAWDRYTGQLLRLSYRESSAAETGPELTSAQGGQQARFWLERIGIVAGKDHVTVTALPHDGTRQWVYRVASAQGKIATVSVDRRTGELLAASLGRRAR